ncbi:MAG: hypothetical protein ABI865_09910 [Nitrosospira sp.]
MSMTKSAILEAVHEATKELHQAGVMDQVTLREFDRLCLPSVEPLKPEQIKQIRGLCCKNWFFRKSGFRKWRKAAIWRSQKKPVF